MYRILCVVTIALCAVVYHASTSEAQVPTTSCAGSYAAPLSCAGSLAAPASCAGSVQATASCSGSVRAKLFQNRPRLLQRRPVRTWLQNRTSRLSLRCSG